MRRSPLPRLHVVTDDALLADPGFAGAARTVLAAGGARIALHLRGPRTDGRRTFDLAVALVPAARETGALLLVNDRVDVALAAEADGVQLGTRGVDPADARRLLGPQRWIGASVHDGDEAEAARAGGADFLLVGTLWPTDSHPGRPGGGPELLRSVRDAGLPPIAIGGVTPARAREVREADGAGVAVLRGVWGDEDPAAAVERYLRAWESET